jgi:hypothetical protein
VKSGTPSGPNTCATATVSSPRLPSDCLAPHMLRERAAAQCERRVCPAQSILERRPPVQFAAEQLVLIYGLGHSGFGLGFCRCSRPAPIRCRSARPPTLWHLRPPHWRQVPEGPGAGQDLLPTAPMATEKLVERRSPCADEAKAAHAVQLSPPRDPLVAEQNYSVTTFSVIDRAREAF